MTRMRYEAGARGRHRLLRTRDDGQVDDFGFVAFVRVEHTDAGDPYRWSVASHLDEPTHLRRGSARAVAGAIREAIAAAPPETAALDVSIRVSRYTVEDYDSAEVTPMPRPLEASAVLILRGDPDLPDRAAAKLMELARFGI